MFYTIYWPIPVEVLVRVKYPMQNCNTMYYCAGFEDGIYCPCNIHVQLFFVVVVKRKILIRKIWIFF